MKISYRKKFIENFLKKEIYENFPKEKILKKFIFGYRGKFVLIYFLIQFLMERDFWNICFIHNS